MRNVPAIILPSLKRFAIRQSAMVGRIAELAKSDYAVTRRNADAGICAQSDAAKIKAKPMRIGQR